MKSGWEIIENKLVAEKLYKRIVEPGLELYILPKPGYRKKYAIYSTRFGSIDNKYRVEGTEELKELPQGVAHFLEHKLFEDERGNVFDRFAALGASSNAFTSFTTTTYLFSTTENFAQSLELLLDFVQEPYFTAESVKNEQGIIGQEIKMYEDHPQWRVFFNLLEALYQEHPVRYDIAGTVESIAQITPDLLYRCYRTYYHPSNMGIFVVGDVDPDRVGEQVEANIGRRNYQPLGEILRFYPQEPPGVSREKVIRKMVVSQPIFNLGFKDPDIAGLSGADLLRREIAMDLLLDIVFARSEELFDRLYREGLIDDRFGAGYAAEKTYAYTLIGGETKDPDRLYRLIMEGIAEVRNEGIGEEKFERHRRSQLGAFMRQFNSLEFIANNFLAYRFRDADFFSYPDLLREITLSEVEELLRHNLAPGRHAVSIVMPQ